MWEVFIFINPIGKSGLTVEKALINFNKKHNIAVHLTFVPLSSVQIVNNYIKYNHLNQHDLKLRNQITQNITLATHCYKAATLQGKRKSRQFLMSLQEAVDFEKRPFNIDLVKEIATQSHLDVAAMLADQNSNFTAQQCLQDQQRANQLNIQTTPSIVVFDYSNAEDDQGVIIEAETGAQLAPFLNKLVSQRHVQQNPDLHILD